MGLRKERHDEAPGDGRWAVELRGVRRQYGRGGAAVHALRGIDLVLPRGGFTAVMGPSGSGKSTFLQCAAGLDRPTGGTVRLGGTLITSMSENKLTALRRARLGFVFQAFNLLPSLTVEQNVVLPLRLAGHRPDRRRAAETLDRVGLGDKGGRRPGQLSGGQQQRVAIARALITRPDVVFADEPTGALDAASSAGVLGLLRTAVDGMGATVVMVTHDPAAAACADRVLFLADGRIADALHGAPARTIAARVDALTAPAHPGSGCLKDRAKSRGRKVGGMLTLEQVEALARGAHATQTDKAGRPYAEHLEAVAEGVRARGGDDEQIAAAWLHDAVEDDALSREWLDDADLTDRTKAVVLALTKRPGEPPEAYAQRILATPGALLVKESDLAHNADPARLAVLDQPTRQRLTRKYAAMRALLGLTAPA